MKINITEDEYRNLIDMIYIADWVLTSYKNETGPELEKYQELRNKFYALAKEMGMENLIEYDKELGGYFETQEFEDASGCQQLIDEYDNDSFWERLIEELTMRDLQAEFAGKKTKDKDPDEYFARYAAIEKKYMKEFEKYGLENVTFKKGKPARTTN